MHPLTFMNKYDQRTERMSIRIPVDLKNHIWARAGKEKKSATDVVVDIITAAFKNLPPAPQWEPGTTKGGSKDDKKVADIFA